MIIANGIFCQTEFHFSHNLDSVLETCRHFKEVKKFLGYPATIRKRNIDQMFCGITRGQDIQFIYRKLKINMSGRKRLGYVHPEDIGKGKAYYDNCSVTSICISSRSRIKINGIKLRGLDTAKVIKCFGEPMEAGFDDKEIYLFEVYELTHDARRRILFLRGLTVFSYNYDGKELTFYFSPKGKLMFAMIDYTTTFS